MEKRGQVAIFVIIAIVIVSVVITFLAYPRLSANLTELNPNSYMKTCIEPDVRQAIEIMNKQGGYLEPTHSLLYEDTEIQYLCYSSENYLPCLVQQPLLKQHMEGELQEIVEPRARQCLNDLKEEYESRGYSVSLTEGEASVSFVPGSILIETNSEMSVSREDTRNYNSFKMSIGSEMYDLVMLSTNIVQFESTLGDSEVTLYMQYYPDIKIEKIKRDADTIYKVSNVITKEEFVFATRSLVWPQGYGLE